MTQRRLFARIVLVVGALTTLWAAVLLIHGGFDTTLLGLRVRSNDPSRLIFLAIASAFAVVALVGDGEHDAAVSSAIETLERFIGGTSHQITALCLAIAVAAVGIVLGSTVAGGSDSYGYISQAELWLHGHLSIAQPWTTQAPWPDADRSFAPLGYHPGPAPGVITPTYSAGLPMLMALAKLFGGQRALFFVVPICGATLVFGAYRIGRRLIGPLPGLIAAWFLATSPAFLCMLVVPMSDLPAAAAWTVALDCALADAAGWAAGAGVAAAIAILIRPNLVPVALVPLIWLARRNRRHAAVFLLAMLPGVVITALLNWQWNGSALVSGYGSLTDIFSISNLADNAKHYATWLWETQTVLVFLGLAALFAPVRRLWPRGPIAAPVMLGAFALAVCFEYCAYMTFGAWEDLRFLLPIFACLTVGEAAVVRGAFAALPLDRMSVAARRSAAMAAGLAILALGIHTATDARDRQAFAQQAWEMKYPSIALIVAAKTDPNAVVIAGQHSGSLRYYAGRETINYYNLDAAWLDRAAAWLNAHGAHPYVLLEDFEIPDFKARFAAANSLGALPMKPMLFYESTARIYLFDLMATPRAETSLQHIVERRVVPRLIAPAPPPAIVFK